jgi:hypothetical protein
MMEDANPAPAPKNGAGTAEPASIIAPAHAQPSEQPVPVDWRTDLPGDLRRGAAKFRNPADLMKSYTRLEQRLGRSITVPAADAPPDQIASFYDRLGRPQSSGDYDIAVPAGLSDHLNAASDGDAISGDFLAAMHQAGAPTRVVQAAIDWYFGALTSGDTARAGDSEKAREVADAALHRDWGGDYERNSELARRAERYFGDDELATVIKGAGLNEHPAWRRALARIGSMAAEDQLMPGASADATGDARSRIDRLIDQHFGHPSYTSAPVQSELRTLYQSLYGTAPGDRSDPA